MRPSSVLRSISATLLGGVLVGFVAAAVAGAAMASGTITGRASEATVARSFMVGLLSGDSNAVDRVRPMEGVIARAAREQSTGPTAGWTPTALSYMGGAEQNGVGIYVYVAQVRSSSGETSVVPFTLTVGQGKVLRVQ